MKTVLKLAAAGWMLLALPALAQPLNPFITFTPFRANGLYKAGDVDLVTGVLGFEPGQVPVALDVGGLVVVERAALLTVAASTAAGDSVVVEVGALAHGWCSSSRKWSGQG